MTAASHLSNELQGNNPMTKQRRLSRKSVAPRLLPRACKAARFTLPELLEARTLLSSYLVTSNADDGSAGTLRDAMAQVNLGNYSEIDFAGPMTIALSS